MERIIASRGMGKTSRLISEAKQAMREGKKIIFVTVGRAARDRLSLECPGVEFMTFDEIPLRVRGRRFHNTKILVDDLDIGIASLFGTSDFTYTLTLGD